MKPKRLTRIIASTPDAAAQCCTEIQEYLIANGLQKEVFPVALLLHESMNNAIMHGNKMDPSKKVSVRIRHNDKRLILCVTDEGPGFCWKQLANHIPDTTATHGRGFPIFTLYANRVRFNPAGNQVILVKTI